MPIDLSDATQGNCAKGELKNECGCVVPPRLRHKVEPTYPSQARREHVEGKVVLVAIVGTDGKVGDIKVMSSTPPGSGFEEAAHDAVRRWRYRPATVDKKPVAVSFTVVIEFGYGSHEA